MQATLPQSELVLLGVGHTNAHIVRMWRMNPIPNARLTCVSNFSKATYSGMLPGTLAGQYPLERMEIDLVRLCAVAGARLIVGEVSGLDLERQELLFHDRPPLPFDALSIGVGSVPRLPPADATDETMLPIKPMQTFLPRLDERLRQLARQSPAGPLKLAVVGAGAGGVEIAFCLPRRVELVLGARAVELVLVDAAPDVLTGSPHGTVKAVKQELARRNVQLVLGKMVGSVQSGQITFADGSCLPADLVLWAGSATAPPLLKALGLPTDANGFLLTRPSLQSVGHDRIFAVGDTGTSDTWPTPKAGVYAVRQGPILWENLQRLLRREPLVDYVPQRGFLSLLNLGDGRAILSYKGHTFRGAWCWRLKDRIDSRFMDMYQDYTPMSMAAAPQTHDGQPPAMRCAGCGGKVGGSVLSQVLQRLDIPPSEHVLLGLEQPDDAAIIRAPGGRPVVCTVDFFAAFLDDPYLVGRVAALNAASDLFAMGAKPLAALALATIPVGPPRQQEQLLYELLAGGLQEFRRMGATLIGGHTIEGPQVTIGYAMLADAGPAPPRTKGGLRPADLLVLTKPLGTGILLAAHGQARCKAPWMDVLLRQLLVSNQAAADAALEFNLAGLTDVTGFGLAGHLLEMLRPSGAAAEIWLDALPLLPGVGELVQQGVQSTLAPANRAAEAEIEAQFAVQTSWQYAVLFDPQTSGGMLLGVPEGELEQVLRRLESAGEIPPVVIGRVSPHQEGDRRLRVIAAAAHARASPQGERAGHPQREPMRPHV